MWMTAMKFWNLRRKMQMSNDMKNTSFRILFLIATPKLAKKAAALLRRSIFPFNTISAPREPPPWES